MFCGSATTRALFGLAAAVASGLPKWNGRLTPHVLRHYCASSLYTRGMDLKAIQDLLGHEWLSLTTRYIHVHSDHVEKGVGASQRTSRRVARRTRRLSRANGGGPKNRLPPEKGIWKSTELRRRLAEAGLEISAGKMSALWTGTPTTIRLEDLDVICHVLFGREPPSYSSPSRTRSTLASRRLTKSAASGTPVVKLRPRTQQDDASRAG